MKKPNDDTNRANIKHDFSGFVEFVENHSMTTIPAGTEQEVLNVAGSMSYLAYRWLTYQHDLDSGVEDQQLADQQHDFLSDINGNREGLAGE